MAPSSFNWRFENKGLTFYHTYRVGFHEQTWILTMLVTLQLHYFSSKLQFKNFKSTIQQRSSSSWAINCETKFERRWRSWGMINVWIFELKEVFRMDEIFFENCVVDIELTKISFDFSKLELTLSTKTFIHASHQSGIKLLFWFHFICLLLLSVAVIHRMLVSSSMLSL
jgi:hypothetical protein